MALSLLLKSSNFVLARRELYSCLNSSRLTELSKQSKLSPRVNKVQCLLLTWVSLVNPFKRNEKINLGIKSKFSHKCFEIDHFQRKEVNVKLNCLKIVFLHSVKVQMNVNNHSHLFEEERL